MNLNKFSKPFPTKSSVLMVLLLAALFSCNGFKEADSLGINRVKVVDSGKDTIFSIANQKPYDALRVTIEGALADTSVIAFSSSKTFLGITSFFVPNTSNAFSETLHLSNIKGDSLFIEYHPIRNSNSGDVKIGVTFL